jgi:hypothetical protein
MIMLQVLRLPRDTHIVVGQPDDRQRCNQLWHEEDPLQTTGAASEAAHRGACVLRAPWP